MRKVVLLGIVAALFRAQPATAQDVPSACSSPASNNAVIVSAPGTSFAVALESNPGTGYSWTLAMPPDPAVAAADEVLSIPSSRALPGAPAVQCFTFAAIGSGSTVIEFAYARPFEPDGPPAKTVKTNLLVRSAAPAPVQLPASI